MQKESQYTTLKDDGYSNRKKPHKSKDYDCFMKIVLVGSTGVGKSSVMLRFTDDKFNETYVNTIGVDFRFRTLILDGKRVKMQLWDTAGQEKFRTMTSTYYRGADVIFLVYDITDKSSYDDVMNYWAKEVENNGPQVPFIVLIGTKKDLESRRQVPAPTSSFQDISLGNLNRNVRRIEVSSKLSENVYDVFAELGREFIKHKASQKEKAYQEGRLSSIRESAREGEISSEIKLTTAKGDITKDKKSGCSC